MPSTALSSYDYPLQGSRCHRPYPSLTPLFAASRLSLFFGVCGLGFGPCPCGIGRERKRKEGATR
eukprot:scaffold230733_cov36-Tisochrysis_lutea.AAC.1